ncbi:hypothetical protein SGPA1_11433 [Streptomyces misionensis JCM 4497]
MARWSPGPRAGVVPRRSHTATPQSRYAHENASTDRINSTSDRQLTQPAPPGHDPAPTHSHGTSRHFTAERHKATNAPAHLRVRPGGDPPSRPRRWQRAAARSLDARRAVAVVQGDGGRPAAGAADPALLAAREIRGGPGERRPAAQRRAGGLRLLRGVRADRRDREVRHRPGDQVRDVRDHPDPRRHDRRAAGAGLDPALGAAEGAQRGARLRHPGGPAAAHPHRERGGRRTGHGDRRTARRLQPVVARQRRRPGGAAARRRRGRGPAQPHGHAGGHRRGQSRGGGRGPGAATVSRARHQHAAGAGEDRRHALLLRGPHPRRDRQCARGHREPGQPDPHQVGAPVAGQAGELRALTGSPFARGVLKWLTCQGFERPPWPSTGRCSEPPCWTRLVPCCPRAGRRR